jgi:hypothetical protein
MSLSWRVGRPLSVWEGRGSRLAPPTHNESGGRHSFHHFALWPRLNVAVTLRAALIVTVQVPVPLQAPLQPTNEEPDPGSAVSVTAVPDP